MKITRKITTTSSSTNPTTIPTTAPMSTNYQFNNAIYILMSIMPIIMGPLAVARPHSFFVINRVGLLPDQIAILELLLQIV